MRSSLIYWSHAGIADFFSKTCIRAADLISLQHFYVGLAKNKLQLVESKSEEIRLKPLLGAIHASMSCESTQPGNELPPHEILKLLNQTCYLEDHRATIENSLTRRRQGMEAVGINPGTKTLLELVKKQVEMLRERIPEKTANSPELADLSIGQLVQSVCFAD